MKAASVLVIGTVSRLALAVVRGLGTKGVRVYTADSLRYTRCRFSRYSLGHFRYTSPFEDEQAFVNDIKKIIDLSGAEVLFPADDEIYFSVLKNAGAFQGVALIPMSDPSSVGMVNNKRELWALSRKLDIDTPWTRFIDDGLDILYHELDSFAYPVMLKPVNSCSGRQLFFADGPALLKKILDRNANSIRQGKYLLQQYVNGDHIGAAYLYNKQLPVCGITYRQIQQMPVSGGIPVLTESNQNPGVLNVLKRILDHLNWHGMCQADFIVENQNGRAYLIDINPRLFSSLFQAIAANVNFPFLLYRISINEKVEEQDFSEGVRNVWLEGQVARMINRWTQKPFKKKLDLVAAFKNVDVIEDIAFRDYSPFLFLPFCFGYKKLKKRMKPQNTSD